MDTIVVGAGLAGLTAALSLSPRPVTLVALGALGTLASTAWAQGGIAAAVGPDDSPERHAADTLAAGAGLSDPAATTAATGDAAAAVAALTGWGVDFDRAADGALALGLEAAHSARRIVHAEGDGSGRSILQALARRVLATPSIRLVEGFRATRLLTAEGRVIGLAGRLRGRPVRLYGAVVLATGGLGGLYAATTNPLTSTGSGLALAARAGAVLRDLEFVQFHPTALALGQDPMPLASEAIRGEGAILINGRGERFMADLPGAELAPRDQVSRAVWAEIAAGQAVFLDARKALGSRFAQRFPTVAGTCAAAGLDPAREPMPIRPAVHYHMGGIRVDLRGRSSLPGLWACGEVAATGLHGANRLASNSLLEAVVWGRRVAEDIAGSAATRLPCAPAPLDAADAADGAPRACPPSLRALMDRHVGVIRDEAGLLAALSQLRDIEDDAVLVARLIAVAALRRRESRGAHCRRDCPQTAAIARHSDLTLADAFADVPDHAPETAVAAE